MNFFHPKFSKIDKFHRAQVKKITKNSFFSFSKIQSDKMFIMCTTNCMQNIMLLWFILSEKCHLKKCTKIQDGGCLFAFPWQPYIFFQSNFMSKEEF